VSAQQVLGVRQTLGINDKRVAGFIPLAPIKRRVTGVAFYDLGDGGA
jgi:hypothetical protein